MGNIKNNENLEMCRYYGGMCCIKSGCDYSAKDFKDCSYNTLVSELSKGNISIVCFLKFMDDKSYEPFLYLRARNVNRDIIDLISMKTRCSMLTDTGCVHDYKHRPEGGRNLIPKKEINGTCIPDKDPKEIVMSWKPHQKTLKRIVLQYTGMSLDKKIRLDVENLFYEVLCENYEGVSEVEREDLKMFVMLLTSRFPQELKNANERYKNRYSRVLRKKLIYKKCLTNKK